MKKFILIFILLLFCTLKVDAISSAQDYKKYVNRVQGGRATVYNALNLTPEQIKIREKLIKEYAPLYDAYFQELIKESTKLKAFIDANMGKIEICKQESIVNTIKQNIKNLMEKENKTFKKCLTHQQRAKFSMIQKLQRDDYKKAYKHQKNYHKSNPQLSEFGNPPQNCECVCDSKEDTK